MMRFLSPKSGFSSPVRPERARPRRSPLFAPEALESKLSPSAYFGTMHFQTASDPTDPEPINSPTYPIPVPPAPPGGPKGPA